MGLRMFPGFPGVRTKEEILSNFNHSFSLFLDLSMNSDSVNHKEEIGAQYVNEMSMAQFVKFKTFTDRKLK